MINFSKRIKVADILREIESCQAVGYSLLPVPEIQEFIVRNVQAAGGDVEGMYERSLALEPRMAGEEKMNMGQLGVGMVGMNMGRGGYISTGSHMSSVVIASMALR